MITALLVLALIVIEGVKLLADRKHRREEKRSVALLAKSWEDLGMVITRASTSAEELQKNAHMALRAALDPAPPKSATRVYAAYLTWKNEHRIYLSAANTMEEFAAHGKAVCGNHWLAEMVEYVDVYPPAETTKYVELAPTKRQQKVAKLEDFVHQLELARDTFTETDYQKKAVDVIIKNVKTKYGQLIS